MSEIDLRSLIELADAGAARIFKHTGQLLPMWHAFTADGEQLILPQPDPDKDISVEVIRVTFVMKRVEAYVFMSEAWMLATTADRDPDLSAVAAQGLAHHPDRREAIMYAAENDVGGEQTASRFILRPEHGKAKLSPLVMDDMKGRTSSGRMVGLLQRRR